MLVLTKHPVVAFPLSAALSWHFDETLIKRQIMSYRVLPSFLVLFVECKLLHDVLVDLREGGALLGRVVDGHGDERDVGVGRLDAGVVGRVGGGRRRRGPRRAPLAP